METIICFVATDKHPYLEEQVERYKPYFKDVVIMLDKNYDNLELPYLQIKDMKNTNYSNVLIGMGKKLQGDKYTNSWSKAMYYYRDLDADNVWFIEYDVFIPNIDLLLSINQHKEHLLVKDNIRYTGKKGEWSHWTRFKQHKIDVFGDNLYHSMVCICRVSKELIKLVDEFATKYKKLFYHEILFNTLAENNNLSIKLVNELKKVVFMDNRKSKGYGLEDVCNNYIYHPVKDLRVQKTMFQSLNKKTTD